ncbi:MAG: hypothetical protein NTX64_13710 [Elusimicrobia bacterium]|nr:hypothetical protein [Elusimicrobiota bacterium]
MLAPAASHAADAPSPLYDASREPLAKDDAARLTKAGYIIEGNGRVLKPRTAEPVEAMEMPRILEELESRQRLEAMLRLDLIFNKFGYKNLPPDPLTDLRMIGRQNWSVLPTTIKADLRPYFSGRELEAMDAGASPVRIPKTWLGDDEALAPSQLTAEDDAPPRPAPAPARPLSPANTMSTTPLPAPWAVTTAAPAIPTATPAVPTATPAVQIAKPAVATATPAVPTAAPAVPAATPAVPTATPAIVAMAAPWIPPAAPSPVLQAQVPAAQAAVGAATLVAVAAGTPSAAVAVAAAAAAVQASSALAAPAAAASKPASPAAAPASHTAPAVAVISPAPPVETKAAAPPEPAQAPRPAALEPFVEYPMSTHEEFLRFLQDAPYGRDVHDMLDLISHYADPEDRALAVGVVERHVPAVIIDSSRAGALMAAAVSLPEGSLGTGKVVLALHAGPVVARKRGLLFSSDPTMVPESAEFYRERGTEPPNLQAAAPGASSGREEEADWGRVRIYDDGSRRLKFSNEELAGALLAELLRVDARARGWDDFYRVALRARSAQFRFYRRFAASTGAAPHLDRALEAEYGEWLARPWDWQDHWVQALSSPMEQEVLPGLEGGLEDRLAAKGAAEDAALERAGIKADRPRASAKPEGEDSPKFAARVESELKQFATPGPEAEAWLGSERRFRRGLSDAH